MTIRHLKIFIIVANTGSITKASEILFLSQPTVSVAVKELEHHYGIKLFDRINQRLKITEDGKNFLSYASHAVSIFDDMEKTFGNPDHQNILHAGASVTVGIHNIPLWVTEFAQICPNTKVHVKVVASDEIEKNILENTLDFAVIEGVIHSEYIHSHIIGKDRLIAVCSPSHPFSDKDMVSLKELIKEPLLLREKSSGAYVLLSSMLHLHGFDCTPSWESTSIEALKQAAAQGIGIAVLPEKLVEQELLQNKLIRITLENFEMERSIRLIYHKNKFISPAMKRFFQIME